MNSKKKEGKEEEFVCGSAKKGPRGAGHFESRPADPSNVLLSY